MGLAFVTGCFQWQPDSDLQPHPDLEARVRMEIIENRLHRDSLVDVFVGIRVSHTLPGRVYLVAADIDFEGQARSKGFSDSHAAQDTVLDLSWIFTEEIKPLRGATLRARFTIDSVEFGRDSVTYY